MTYTLFAEIRVVARSPHFSDTELPPFLPPIFNGWRLARRRAGTPSLRFCRTVDVFQLRSFAIRLSSWTGLVSVSVRPARSAYRDLRGTRDTTPVLCRWFAACRRGTRHWRRWRSVGMPSSRAVDPGSKWGRRRGAALHGSRGERERRSDRVARSWVVTAREGRHLGWSLAKATRKSLTCVGVCASSLPAGAGVVTTLVVRTIGRQ